jgi:hypothetical protein
MAQFKKLVGTRVLLTKPKKPESKIMLDPSAEAAMEAEMMLKWTALEVYAVGEDVTSVAAGDKVYVETYALQNAGIIVIDDDHKMMIAERDIAIIW